MSDNRDLPAPDPDLKAAALRVVGDLLGGRSGGLRAEWIPAGVMTQKFVVHAGPSPYVVRFYPPSRAFVVEFEPDLLGRCESTGARVPRVVSDSRTGPAAEWPYVVYRYIPGDALSMRAGRLTEDRWRGLARDIGAELAKLREVRFDGFGELSTAWRACDASWADFVRRSFETGIEAARSAPLFPAPWLATIADVIAGLDRWDLGAGPSMVWSDFQLGNILVDGEGRLAGLIDFEGALSGDSLATLGYGFARYGHSPRFDALMAAWPEPLGPSESAKVALYAWLRVLRIAPHARNPLPAGGHRRPLTDYFAGLEDAVNALGARRT